MARQWISIVVLLAMALGTGWVLHRLDPNANASPDKPPHVPDVYLERFVTTAMDVNGHPRRRLEARYMATYPDDTSELDAPYLIVYRDTGAPWHVRSERGWVSANGEVILLLGKVDIWRNGPSGERALDIRTSDLRVLPDSDYGETEEPVVIRTPTSESHGVGMRAYLDKSRLEMLSRVHTLYDRHMQ